jgi:UDP-N-acetylmuramate--alanine ligase
MLIRAKFDPTVIVGTRLKEFNNSNFRYGRSKYFVLEADEWRGAFWNYHPNIAILTNLDREHLDFYINFRGVKSGFRKFLSNIKEDGVIIANGDDENLRNLVTTIGKKYIFYTINSPDAKLVRKVIKIPGEHNVSNSMAVLALARYLNIPKKIALDTIKSFKGSWRRFEYKGLLNGAKLYDDYAHHPTEIRLTLEAARSITPPEGRLFAVFQPHQYQRLKILFREFRRAFDFADRILILPCYMPAGRDPSGAGSKFYKLSEELAYSISKRRKYAEFAPSFEKASEILKGELKRYDVCMIFGAGDIVKIHKFLHTT